MDSDHTQCVTLTEFATAIEHLRLKISFEDIKKLFQFMDKDGAGDINYAEFTLLTEEKW
jgi:Ca2+-binding EF-hand superfamily protein